MTVRTITLKGGDAGAYYVEKELGYYLDRGEPPGRWQGRAVPRLHLGDTVDEETFLALMAGEDPTTGRVLGTKHTDKTDRGFDVTCSAPKGVSVLFAVGGSDVRREVLEAHDAAVAAVVDWIEDHAHTRYRVNGEIRTFDADGILVAKFRHHTSRVLDPQVHTHAVIVNRVASPDGRWLALDARTIKKDQQTLSRLYHSGLRAEMTRRLGVRWNEPTNGIAEIDGIPADVLQEFSQRTEAIDRRIDEKIDQFEEANDREPTLRERWRLERQAALDTRPHKDSDADPVTLQEDWHDRLRQLGLTPTELVAEATERRRGLDRIDDATRSRVAADVVEALTEKQSTWRAAEVVREVAAAVPTDVAMPAEDLTRWVDTVANEVVRTHLIDLSWPAPDHVPRRRDGRPITESAVDRVLTTPDILAQEQRLQELAERRFGAGGVDHQIEAIEGLTPAQAQLATAVAGERQLVLAVGPAGTGKTTALRPGIEQLRTEGRAVFGVGPSAAAAEVLAVDTGVDADTLDKLLIEHNLDRPLDHRYDLPAGSTVVVDESAMVSTPKLAEHVELAYAETSHASQGRTVDRSFLFLDGPTGAAGIYVPMTRGRESNEVFVAVRGEETPVDVISEALSRTWIDRPAIAVRDELTAPAVDDDGGPVVRAMPGHQLKHVVERAAEVQAALRKIDFDREHKERTHRQAVGRLDAARRQLRAMEHQLSVALAESERFNRPLVRHLHRAEVESARTQLGWLPAAVDRQRAKVEDLERQVDSSKGRSLADRLDEGRERKLQAELAELRSQLTDDAHARGRGLAENTTDVVRDRLGPAPSGAATLEAWIEAAGRTAQHQAAWDVPEEYLLGRKPRMFHDDAYELTWQAAAKSMSALDRSIGLPLEREVPSRGLSR